MKGETRVIGIQKFCETYGVERKGTDAVKWDGIEEKFQRKDLLPLWVADMEFKIPKKAEETLIERVRHGAFGYTMASDSYYEQYFNWQKKRFDVTLEKDWVRFSTGVVNSFFWMVNTFTEKNDSVLVLSPVYYPFYDAIRENQRKIVTSELVNHEGRYEIDFEDVERKIVEEKVKLFIHCSPHNPVGRVWSKKELTKLFDICQAHDVLIISDEIHQDLVRKDVSFTSALAMDEKYFTHLIALNAPSKTFNLAGLLHSHIVIPDKNLRRRYDDYAKTVHKSALSTLGLVTAEACYRYGEEWLEGLLEVIEFNFNLLKNDLVGAFPNIRLTDKQGTYLAWLDLSSYVPPEDMKQFIEEECHLAIDYGSWFGENCENFIRINLGTLPKYIEEATDRLIAGLNKRQGK